VVKRHMIIAFSAICLVLTACSGSEGSSLQEMPVNTAAPAASVRTETTAATEMPVSMTTTLTMSTQRSTQSETVRTTTSSRAVSSLTTGLTTTSSTTTTTTTTVMVPVSTTSFVQSTVTTATTTETTVNFAVLIAEAEAEAKRLQEEVMLAETAVQSAKNAFSEAQAAHEKAQELAETYEAEHEAELLLYRKGSWGFFSHVGAKDALEVLEHSEYANYTQIGDANDATSLEHMRETFLLLNVCNALREDKGLQPLRITDRLMAIAQSDLNWSDQSFQHARQFPVEENLAWGFDDPFVGWYDSEKAEQKERYRNIVNPEFTVTGFAVCTANRSGQYPISHAQVFSISDDGQAYTVEEYEARFHAYYDSLNQVQAEMTEKKKAASDAEAAAAEQILAVSQAEQHLNETEAASNQADQYLVDLIKQYS